MKYGQKEIKYYGWEAINVSGEDGKSKRCTSCVQKSKSFFFFFFFFFFLDSIEISLAPLPGHFFRARWQLHQLEKLKENIQNNEAVVIMDYAENYTCRFQNEVSNAFLDTNQVTIHPMMPYYKVNDDKKH